MGEHPLRWATFFAATLMSLMLQLPQAAGQAIGLSNGVDLGSLSRVGLLDLRGGGAAPNSDEAFGGIVRFSMQGTTTEPSTQPEFPAAAPAPGPTGVVSRSFPLPFFADEARKRGYDLPLPLGVSPTYTYLQRDIKITDLRLGLNGATPQSVINFVDVGSRVKVNAALGRFDAFIFPFLDVYGLLGYLHEESTTSGTATIRLPGPIGLTRKIAFTGVTPVDGFLTGIGATTAVGYKQIFAAADVNYSVSDLGFDDHFRALLMTLRTGWNGKIAGVPTRIWTGVQYWDTASTASSTVTLSSGERLTFQADQGPSNPVNMLFGTTVSLSKRFGLLIEYGTNFNDMQMVVAGAEFRF
jgi:hypothetical protein